MYRSQKGLCMTTESFTSSDEPTRAIPEEFKYWEQLHSPSNRWLRRILRWTFGVDPVLPEARILEYAHSYFDADPVAEAFVDEVYMQQGQVAGRAVLERALTYGIESIEDAPASMLRLFREFESTPDWLERDKIQEGARIFRRFGTHLYSFAGAITLHGYRENSVAKPLAFTGAYNGESAHRRFLETAQFWIDISEPNGLLPGGQGRQTAMRVRIMHVFVRRRLLQHPDWKLDAWGVPISQGDALLTLMGGSFLPGYGLRALGYRTTRDEIEALMHFWRYIGHLIGVQPRWFPETLEEALGLMYTSHVKSVGSSGADGTQLAHSYIDSYEPTEHCSGWERWSRRWEHGLQKGYIRWFVPPWTHSLYALPKAGIWAFHPLIQFPVNYTLETLRKRHRFFDRWLDLKTRKQTQNWVDRRLGVRKAMYQAVEHFTR